MTSHVIRAAVRNGVPLDLMRLHAFNRLLKETSSSRLVHSIATVTRSFQFAELVEPITPKPLRACFESNIGLVDIKTRGRSTPVGTNGPTLVFPKTFSTSIILIRLPSAPSTRKNATGLPCKVPVLTNLRQSGRSGCFGQNKSSSPHANPKPTITNNIARRVFMVTNYGLDQLNF
jgi:hypothetical protein